MQDKELRKFVDSILEEKDTSKINPDMKDKIAERLTKKLDTQIKRALVDALTDEQLTEFEKLVDNNEVSSMSDFFKQKGVPVEQIMTQTMVRFKAAYLGI